MKHLDKAAHMRALKIMRQIHKQIDCRCSFLLFVFFVQHGDGIFYVFHANFLQRNFSCIIFVLNIFHNFIYIDGCVTVSRHHTYRQHERLKATWQSVTITQKQKKACVTTSLFVLFLCQINNGLFVLACDVVICCLDVRRNFCRKRTVFFFVCHTHCRNVGQNRIVYE